MKTILAVAIGEALTNSPPITTDITVQPPAFDVRPYILGLITSLKGSYTIGTHYQINYQEAPQGQLNQIFTANPNPDIVFVMSVRVLEVAKPLYPSTAKKPIPIVAVVSNTATYTGINVTGFSANRFGRAKESYDKFLSTAPDVSDVYVLHHKNHKPSVQALAAIQAAYPAGSAHAPHVVHVEEGLDITAQLKAIPKTTAGFPNTAGVFVLPIDRCFGDAKNIIDWQNQTKVVTFWPVTDWVNSGPSGAFAGFGVPQEYCGQRMGAKILTMWAGGAIPPFEACKDTDFQWIGSIKTAAALTAKLGSPAGLQRI